MIAYSATNIDNFLALVGLASGGARNRPLVVGFGVAAVATLLLAMSFSLLSYFASPGSLRYLGVIPIAVGVRLLASSGNETAAGAPRQISSVSVALLLAANSVDTVATFGPLFAESAAIVRWALILGYLVTALVMIRAVFRVSGTASRLLENRRLVQLLAPLVMIGMGCYILLDTATDLE